MKQFTIRDIDALGTCYSASRYLPADWSGTILDILDVTECPPEDRLFVVRRSEQLSDKVLRLFAVECAKKAQTYPKNYNPDPSTLKAIEVAEEYAHGRVTCAELAESCGDAYAAYADANDAAAAAAAYAAFNTAYSPYAADSADAADYAADAAYSAYTASASTYTEATYNNATCATTIAAQDDARTQAQVWQVEKLKELIKEYM